MVSKITIFEPHFEGAQFGPASLPGHEPAVASAAPDADVTAETEVGAQSVRRPLLLIGAMAAAFLLGLRAIRRRMARETDAVEIEERDTDEATLTH
jgi:hypothetical protein